MRVRSVLVMRWISNTICEKWRNTYFWHTVKGLLLHDIVFKLPLISTVWTIKRVAEVFCVGYIHENFVLYITPAVELPPPQKISRANLYQNVDTRKYDPKRRNSITFLCRNPKGGFHKNRCFHSVLQSISWVPVARSNCIILPKGNDKYSFPSYE